MKAINLFSLFLCLILISCSTESEADYNFSDQQEFTPEPLYRNIDSPVMKLRNPATGKKQSKDTYVALAMAEYITSTESGQIGNTIYFNNRGNKKLSFDFVPFLSEDGTPDISYYVDNSRPSKDLDVNVTNAAIDRAMNTWDELTCSDLGIYEYVPEEIVSTGYITKLLFDLGYTTTDFGGSYDYFGDVVHSGWLPAEFFDIPIIFGSEGGSDSVIGVTFTINYTDEFGIPIDLDNNGKSDVAWREIYYNDNFTWNDGSTFDVESIALHEAGHGLSQAHFGKLFQTDSNEKFHFSPRAVMNAGYVGGAYTDIQRTDEAGHCSNWASWSKR